VHHRLFVALVVLSILWNGVAGATQSGLADAAHDIGHAELHLKKVKHHHHEDGHYQIDESRSSVAHITADASHANLAIGGSEARILVPRLGAPPPMFLGRWHSSPYLPPLQRPPRPLT
jgi:hypothetical protein